MFYSFLVLYLVSQALSASSTGGISIALSNVPSLKLQNPKRSAARADNEQEWEYRCLLYMGSASTTTTTATANNNKNNSAY